MGAFAIAFDFVAAGSGSSNRAAVDFDVAFELCSGRFRFIEPGSR